MNFILRNDQIRAHMIGEVAKLPVGGDVTYEVRISEHHGSRSEAASRLYWKWVEVIGCRSYKVKKLNKAQRDELHLELKHEFLGYESIKTRTGMIKDQLKSTSKGKISVKDMYIYMLKIDIWTAERGCYLPRPQDSDYEKYKEASQ